MQKEYIEMTVKELRDYIENMPEGTVASLLRSHDLVSVIIEMPMVEEDE